jgi:uncharacterized protein YjdB
VLIKKYAVKMKRIIFQFVTIVISLTAALSCDKNEYIPVVEIELNKTTTVILVGSSEQLQATVYPTGATDKKVGWYSDDSSIATVDANGLVKGVSVGMTIIRVTDNNGKNYLATCAISVQYAPIPVTGVTLDKLVSAIYIGDTEELKATIAPDNASNKNIVWSSNNASVATVTENGVVTGISAGTATVTVTTEDGGFVSGCTVSVSNETSNVTSTGWTAPIANNYEYSMTYVAQVAFRGSLSVDTNTEVAAFVGNELRGFAKLAREPQLDTYLIHLIIYGNNAGNETVVLKAYNPSKHRIYDNCKEFPFQGNANLGSASEILNCTP